MATSQYLNTGWNAEELSVTLFEEAGDALFLFDPESEQLVDVNPMAQRLSGFSRAELLRMQVTYLFRSEIQGGVQLLRHAYQKTGIFHSQEGFFLRQQRSGTWVPVNLTITRLHAEPRTLGLVTARDVREQREALQRLKKAEEELRTVLASVSDCVWSANVEADGRFQYRYFSPVVEQVTGRKPEYFTAGPECWLDIVHQDDQPRLKDTLQCICKGQSLHEELEYRVVWPDASVRWVRDSIRFTLTREGRSARLNGVITDITERKRADRALQASEKLFRTLVEKSADAIALLNADGAIVYASPSTERVLGYTAEEFVGRNACELMHPEELAVDRERFRQLLAGTGSGLTCEIRCRHKDGSWRWLEATGVNRLDDPVVRAIVCNYRDITPRKRAEEELAHERDLLQVLMENIPHLIYFKDNQSRFTRINRAQMLNLGGGAPTEAVGKTDFDYYPPELAREFYKDEQHLLSTGEPLIDKVERQTGDDATERWLLTTKVPIVDTGGSISGIVGVSRDITERQRAEEAIRASEAKYRSLIENLEQGIFLKDRELRFVAVNRFFCQHIGSTEGEIVGKTDFDLYPAQLAEKFQADDRQVLNEGRRLELEEENMVQGKERTVRVLKTPVKDGQGGIVGVLGILWDVTEQRALEAQLRQSQKMEAVGQLAGGIAHDFNNLLTVILGNVSLLQTGLARQDSARDLLAATEKAALRAAELTGKMLGFSRRTTLRLEPVSLNTCIDEGVALLRRTIDPRIVLEVDKGADLWLVQADPGQINQVLMNLCLNARDAMPEGGQLLLETGNVTLDEDAVRLKLEARTGDFVRLRVRDTGRGIPADIMPRIFEPFFTTKPPGKGTGLGLAMVFGIVQQHQGWIDCASVVNDGTRFDIYLPRCQPEATARTGVTPSLCPQHGTETILLADDEPMIRNLGRTILESYGYQVHLAEDGLKAVEIYQREKGHIDLVILDLTMPQLSGRDAFRQLLQIDPEVRVLFASGYSAEHVSDLEREHILGFVAKPYRPEDLAFTVRSVLDQFKSA
jgi:PAS domain S-box-containing protein